MSVGYKDVFPILKEKKTSLKKCGVTLFVDNVSGFMKSYNQVSLEDADKIRSKELYEPAVDKMGIAIKSPTEKMGYTIPRYFKKI